MVHRNVLDVKNSDRIRKPSDYPRFAEIYMIETFEREK